MQPAGAERAVLSTPARWPRALLLLLPLLLLLAGGVAAGGGAPQASGAWIWAEGVDADNVWVAFRGTLSVPVSAENTTVRLAADSKYWLWVDGEPVIREGGLKRGPAPDATWVDTVDLTPWVTPGGDHTLAVLVWYWGQDGTSHVDSGQGGLLTDFLFTDAVGAPVDGAGPAWRAVQHPAYVPSTTLPVPNFRLPESNIRFDARLDFAADWTAADFDDGAWSAAAVVGVEGDLPWGALYERPIPQWRDYGVRPYVALTLGIEGPAVALPFTNDGAGPVVIAAELPYNAQVNARLALGVGTPAGAMVGLAPDNLARERTVRAEYVTASGAQSFENPGWFNAEAVHYTIPAGVTVTELTYRETGYEIDPIGRFRSDDPFLNKLWLKAARTLYVNMRDAFMDTPGRERAQWWGDVTISMGQVFYLGDARGHALAQKAVVDLVRWQRADGTLFSPVPAPPGPSRELPNQMLAAVGTYGIWHYYQNTGDLETLLAAYPAVRDYLLLWELESDGPYAGLVAHRAGDWAWGDWGENIDRRVLDNAWYVLALDAAVAMADLAGASDDAALFAARRASIAAVFDAALWDEGLQAYRSEWVSDADDRANALAVVAGLAPSERYAAIHTVLRTRGYASPYMEKYVLEALLRMGYTRTALARLDVRYRPMVDADGTTLWERWEPGPASSLNHAWAGGPLTLLGQYVAGVALTDTAWQAYHVLPQLGPLDSIAATVPTVDGPIRVDMERAAGVFTLTLRAPGGLTPTVGIPVGVVSDVTTVTLNGSPVWQDGAPVAHPLVQAYAADSGYWRFTLWPDAPGVGPLIFVAGP